MCAIITINTVHVLNKSEKKVFWGSDSFSVHQKKKKKKKKKQAVS